MSNARWTAVAVLSGLLRWAALGSLQPTAMPPRPVYALPPAFVVVHGQLWRVVYDHQQAADFFGSPIGHTEESEQTVYIDPDSDDPRVTTLHELEHALLTVDFSHEEILGHTCVYRTSEQIVRLLRDNPGLADYLSH